MRFFIGMRIKTAYIFILSSCINNSYCFYNTDCVIIKLKYSSSVKRKTDTQNKGLRIHE
jgi:hypothetical protein